jgi:hypothetical protein
MARNRPPDRRAQMHTTLHVAPRHVHATDITTRYKDRTGRPGDDLVSLRLGDDGASVAVLGSLTELVAIVAAAGDQLDAIAARRFAERPDP